MIKISLLFNSVLTLFLFMIPGFILKKSGLADNKFPKAMSLYTLYVAQVAMLVHGFITPFDKSVFKGICMVFLLAFVTHVVFYIIAKQLFKKAPDKRRKVLQFGIIFSNAGYMGIPVINYVFGSEFTIYATVYVVWFNVFAYTLGRLICTGDKKYISLKEGIINPAVLPISVGLVIFLSGAGGWIQTQIASPTVLGQGIKILYDVLTTLKNTVAPVSMIVIGSKLADIEFKGIFKDKYMYPFIFIRLFLFPAIMWLIMRPLHMIGFIDSTVMSIVFILTSTPSAAITTIFAELYGGDSVYAGKLVALTTILSVISMPIVAFLLTI